MATMETTPLHGHADWVLRAYQTEGTPASAPVVIKLGYTVIDIVEGRVVEEPPVPTTPLSSLSATSSTKHLAAGRSRPFSYAPVSMVMTSASPGGWRDNSLPSAMIQSRWL
ncbi:unnamed protein product [Musa banksii]